ncbi:hypothetical protein SDJN03_29597, partial [Cucurbita argyrosperma subsp. sororia]
MDARHASLDLTAASKSNETSGVRKIRERKSILRGDEHCTMFKALKDVAMEKDAAVVAQTPPLTAERLSFKRQLAKEQNRAEALSAEALELSTQLQQTTQAYNGLTHLLDKGTHEEDISREGSSTMESSKICFCIPRHKNSHKVDGGSEKSSKSKPSRRKSGAKEGKHSSSSDSSGNGNTGAASAAGSAAAVAAIAVTAVTMDAVDEDDGGSTHVHGGEGGGGGGGD